MPEQTSPQIPSPRPLIEYLLVCMSSLGILDASYLTYKHFVGGSLKCGLLNGCDTVTTSVYSTLSGIPVSVFGLGFYVAVFLLALVMIEIASRRYSGLLALLAAGAFAFSGYLVYIQAFTLHSYCLYCIFSALMVTTIFVLSLLLWRRRHG